MKAQDKRLFELHADICQAFSNPKRLEIIALLREGEKSVEQLAKHMGIPKPNLSQHLALLRQKGVVLARREAQSVYYRLADRKIIQACDLMRAVLVERLEKQRAAVRPLSSRK